MTGSKLKSAWTAIALLPLLLMTACAGQPATSASACPQLPPRPVAMQPKPQQAYSASAAQRIETWQQRLTDTLPTLSNARLPGPSE